MSGNRVPLRPEPDGFGLAGGDPAELLELAELVAAGWDGMLELADRIPLEAASRLPGWTARDVLVHLGSWPEHELFATVLDDARHDRVHEVDDPDACNDLVTAAHHDAGRAEILAALQASRDRAVDFLGSAEASTIGRAWTESSAGVLPVNAVLLAGCFELAVHALDLCPPDRVPGGLVNAGLAALVDLAGALAARRGLTITVAVVTPGPCWATGAGGGAWVTVPLPAGTRAKDLGWPAVEGRAGDVLDAAAGRQLGVQLVLTRRLRLHDPAGLLRLTAALDAVPGLPGGSALRTAAQALGQAGQLVGRLGTTLRGRNRPVSPGARPD